LLAYRLCLVPEECHAQGVIAHGARQKAQGSDRSLANGHRRRVDVAHDHRLTAYASGVSSRFQSLRQHGVIPRGSSKLGNNSVVYQGCEG
jgi:hypothetical protein